MERVGKPPKTFGERIKWLFTKDGWPVLASIIVGIIIGFFLNGALGLVIATLAGFAVLYLFKRFPIRINPWQALVVDIIPIVAKLCFFMIFLLPVADYLMLPDGIHNPNTLTRYLSIIIALPKNLFTRPTTDIFPGFAFIVIISVALMFWGSLNLGKMKGWLLAFFGLLLYTFSPTITSVINGHGALRFIMHFFGIGYYLAWVGLILIIVSWVLPRFLKVKPNPVPRQAGMLSILPPIIVLWAAGHLNSVNITGHIQTIGLFDFETLHHTFAAGFSGAVAGLGSGAIIDDSAESGDDTEEPESEGDDGETSPPVEPPPEPPAPQGPVPSTDPEDPPGTTIQHNPDGTIVKTLPDGTVGIKYTDGTVYGKAPDGSSGTYYPDGTSKEWSPEGGLEVTHPNGDKEMTNAQGVSSNIKNNEDGSIDINSGYGGTLHIPKEGNPVGSITGYDGNTMTFRNDGTASFQTSMGTVEIDKDGNMSGTLKDDKGNRLTMNADGTFDAETEQGDKIALTADGLKAKFSDGSFLNTDADGQITSAHCKIDDRTIDANTDDKGALHIKDDRGNSADINADGSGQMKGEDGSTISGDANGNAAATNAEGTTWTTKSDGTGSITDTKGNRIDLGKDGSVTVKDAAGKTTTYTPDQINQMKAQENTGSQPGDVPDSSAGGN
jgi:hypothetical protein